MDKIKFTIALFIAETLNTIAAIGASTVAVPLTSHN